MRTTWLAILLMLAGWSCRKDVETFRPYDISVGEITLALQQVPATQTKSVLVLSNRQADTLFVTPNGTRIFLNHLDQLFSDASGAIVPCITCPDLRLEVVEILRKGDFIARNTTTTTQEARVLESGGVLHLRAFCNGQELHLTPGNMIKIQIPAQQPLIANQLFTNPSASADIFSGWHTANQSVTSAEWLIPGGQTGQLGYQTFTSALQWVCVGRILEEPSSSYCLEMPLGYSGLNTKAYIVLKNLKSVIPLTFQNTDLHFCALYMPQGDQVQIVTISKLGDQYLLGYKETETGGNNSTTLVPQEMSEQQVVEFIKTL